MSSPVKPMLAISNTGSSGRPVQDLRRLVQSGDWIIDTKIDGVRAILTDDGRIYNRRGVDVTYKFPEIENPTSWCLDGEIIAADGTFETTLMRESHENRATIKRISETSPCVFIAFDVPLFAGPWIQRRKMLIELQSHAKAQGRDLHTTPWSIDVNYIDEVFLGGGEGVIIKRLESRYQPGKRSGDWIKWKAVRRISCIAYGYEPGNGSRAHFGALKVALLKDGEVTPVGRTGSGFTERQTHQLKAKLDAGEAFVAEIEYLSYTGNALRFPVFRGIRQDVAITDCLFEQLEA